ncbi:MAG: sensor domain-containing diguanylate cyclase [Bacilli bacterium]|nr:sensor domain-containing diguanylate cyclase [Bacilli bacterium]
MGDKKLTKAELMSRINSLEMLNKELLLEKEQAIKLEYAWTGNLGHWYWNIKTNEVTFNPLKIITLGYEMGEIPEHVTYQFFTEKIHPDDCEKVMKAMREHLYGKLNVYEVEYRIRTKEGNYKWYYDRGKITRRDELGKPIFLAGIVFDITEKKEIERELEFKNKILNEMSSLDGLTKINNHRSLYNHLHAKIDEMHVTKSSLTIALLDIDDFKKINDTKGHIYGVQVLVEIAQLMKNNTREMDVIGRYGGEEFMIIFANTNVLLAANIVERIRKAIMDYPFVEGIQVTISAGVKQYEGDKEITAFIDEADKNLYEAKTSGKNVVIAK